MSELWWLARTEMSNFRGLEIVKVAITFSVTIQLGSFFHTGTSEDEGKVIFGVQNNSTFLECLPHSPQTTIHWFVQHSISTALEQVLGKQSAE